VPVDAEAGQLAQGLASERVVADARNELRLGTESTSMIRKVRRSAAQLAASRQQVPQHFADADELEFHELLSSGVT
jgi:hypothetical protein